MEVAEGYSIAYRGLKNGTHEFRFEVGKPLFKAFESSEIKDGRCVVEVDRCLEDCRVPIDFEGQLLVKFSDEPREYDGEVLWLLPGEDEVDLSQYIYESIVLSLPYQRVHPEGECDPEMLKRFRIVSDEEFSAIENRAEEHAVPEGEWAKLAALRERMEADEAEENGGGTK